MTKQNSKNPKIGIYSFSMFAMLIPLGLSAQTQDEASEDVYELSPFEVSTTGDVGYLATSTLAGTRINTELTDIGSAISVYTKEMMNDVGAVDNQTLLQYALNAEVAGTRGNWSDTIVGTEGLSETHNFSNPNASTRVRGLAQADNTRNFFLSDVPWDGYNVDRVDLQRGPNAILFGLGSPAGVINAGTIRPVSDNFGKVELRVDEYGSFRTVLDINRVLIENELEARVAFLADRQKYQQKPAFEDDDRVYATFSYHPKALNKNGRSFKVSFDAENGNISSNHPRYLPPTDRITPWWNSDFNQQTYDWRIGRNDAGTDTYNPWLYQTFNRGPSVSFNSNSATLSQSNYAIASTTSGYRALKSDGTLNSDPAQNGSYLWQSDKFDYFILSYDRYASLSGLQGSFVPTTLIDPSIFDFYHNLLDDNTKHEWADWKLAEASIFAGFLDNKIGVNLEFFTQDYNDGNSNQLGYAPFFMVDVNEVLPDGTQNPDAGRMMVETGSGEFGMGNTNREAMRAQVYAEYDFAEKSDSIWARIFGKHRFTGVYSTESYDRLGRNGSLMGTTDAVLLLGGTNWVDSMHPNIRYYVSDDLRGVSSPSGLHLPRISGQPTLNGRYTLNYFDTTWIAGSAVDPTAPYANPEGRADSYNTQSANQANYKGWSDTQISMINALSGSRADLDALTTSMDRRRTETDSMVLVWQGYLWDESIIGTFGYREDEQTSWLNTRRYDRDGELETDRRFGPDLPLTWDNPEAQKFEDSGNVVNWGVTVHLNRLLGRSFNDKMPFNVSYYYNSGENFQPEAARRDGFGRQMPSPSGKTTDQSIQIWTKDNKYSLRVSKYETSINNATSGVAGMGNLWTLSQVLFFPARHAYQFQHGLYGDTPEMRYPSDQFPNAEELRTDFMNNVVPAFLKFEDDLQSKYPQFVDYWITQGPWNPADDTTFSEVPPGFAFSEDSVSKGYEIEFIANPLPGWSLAINAAKTEAVRSNVGGADFMEAANYVVDYLAESRAGDMPVWWFADVGVNQHFTYGLLAQTLQDIKSKDGLAQPEIRPWRSNLVTNYVFQEGVLKNLGIGGAIRYEDAFTIDYERTVLSSGVTVPDVNKPIKADKNTSYDLWLSYRKPILNNKVDWKIQINVNNAFADNELAPISINSNGYPGTFRIREGMSWSITNTFEF